MNPGLPLPTPRALGGLATAAALALLLRLLGLPPGGLLAAALVLLVLGAAALVLDARLSAAAWAADAPRLRRRLPPALALGVAREVELLLEHGGAREWRLTLHDHPDGRLGHEGLPLEATLPPGKRVSLRYRLLPRERGIMIIAPAEAWVRSRWGLCSLRRTLGPRETLRVYPDFAQVARYGWLAGDRRLSEIGIKTYAQRGAGTDFKELGEYRPGHDVRQVDWKATLKHRRPIVREYQDERDQCVVFLLDCGRRMRATEDDPLGGGHFDHALNALLLLAHVALASGDEVGVLTCGQAPGAQRWIAPRKGRATLHGLMTALHDLQPEPHHADLEQAAAELMRRQRRRALVVVITNLRDDDADDAAPALALLRSRHLVLLASLRERALRAAAERPLHTAADARHAAAAQLLLQARRDAFGRLAARDALMLDTEPEALPAALVNRYHAVKASGVL